MRANSSMSAPAAALGYGRRGAIVVCFARTVLFPVRRFKLSARAQAGPSYPREVIAASKRWGGG